MKLTRRAVLAGGFSTAVVSMLPGCGWSGRGWSESEFSDAEMGRFDVCVIGSGFAGTHLGLQLVEAGYRTAIVEVGDERGLSTRDAFEVQNTGKIDYAANATRAIVLGGTSSIWSGVVNRLRPADFHLSSTYGMDVDWPISYEDLAPYYCQAETALAARGRPFRPGAEPPRSCEYPLAIPGPYVSLERTFEGQPVPFFSVPLSKRNDQPVRLVDEEIPRFERSPMASLFVRHRISRLITEDGHSIAHAEVQTPSGAREKLRARYFVVASGVIESPRLLLLSRSQWFPDGLGNRQGLVGANFVEHPTSRIRFKSNLGVDLGNEGYRTYVFNEWARGQGLSAYSYQLHVGPTGAAEWKVQPEMEPVLDNRVTLSRQDVDSFGDPIPSLSFNYTQRDEETIRAGQGYFLSEAIAMGADANELEVLENFRAHPAGTCRMGFDESDGVVDRNNRVFGISNLFVSGASVYPVSGTSNPTLSVVAMTLRLADHLKSVLRG